MAEPVTFITWCTDASPPADAGKQPAPPAYVHSSQDSTSVATAVATGGPSNTPPASAVKSISILWPGPVQLALAVLILVASACLAYQTFRTAKPGAESSSVPTQLLDLNLAGEAELRLLPGIGPKLAQRIVEHRHNIGKFRSVDELRLIPGIGPVTLAKLRLRVTVEDALDASDGDPVPRAMGARPVRMMTKTETAKGNEIIDVNRANAAELRKIPWVGPVLSKNIVDFRTAKGPFIALEDLCKVPGIKSKMLEKIKPYITLDGDHQAQTVLP